MSRRSAACRAGAPAPHSAGKLRPRDSDGRPTARLCAYRRSGAVELLAVPARKATRFGKAEQRRYFGQRPPGAFNIALRELPPHFVQERRERLAFVLQSAMNRPAIDTHMLRHERDCALTYTCLLYTSDAADERS